MVNIVHLTVLLVALPLFCSIIAGFFRHQIGRRGAHIVTITGVTISFILSMYVSWQIFSGLSPVENVNLFNWASGHNIFPYSFHLGFMIDALTCAMLLVVTFVSMLVHIYSIGYMADDDGYQRFFSYISLFTFMMLMLVTSNNFLQLFFGWEGVGLVSYLLIGFWYNREAALSGSLKAFLVNRVGDFGFILGIALILVEVGSLDYINVFQAAKTLSVTSIDIFANHEWSVLTVICMLLFIGAMGKSAQVPLHVWLPESMEGPTPISALIHAATMVTAGVFMVARISPMMEYSEATRSFILVIGATGALFTGILGIVMNDIKRVVAYSTLSQLGYMMVAMGASAYSAGMFHLITHACFKALLFLGAGSVIMGMHHEQDMRKMGGLWKKMPITYVTYLIGSLALCAIPPFSGFFSKETIIEAAQVSIIPGAKYAYICVLIGAMVTAIYTFRSFFMTFHGTPRMDKHTWSHVHESPKVVWIPLVVLAIPSVFLGMFLFYPVLFGGAETGIQSSLLVMPQNNVLAKIAEENGYVSALGSVWYALSHAIISLPFWLTLAGIMIAWIAYCRRPEIPAKVVAHFKWLYLILINKYGFDRFNEWFFVKGGKKLGAFFFKTGDQTIIDGMIVNGSSRGIGKFARALKLIQTGYLYHYATVMIIGMFGFLCWMLLG